ncbi:hypothetical protein C2E25_16795 [Geothermobacter hydrogeniphilus]|uniref:Uncharacterized protein n=1 Tax=Geothermobacter hydrogeniphilus TaxID=1969733 RepID=A0A2K2H5S8_9BACT|nr:hypothetical protein [Geothermobacter hydrogeniphilus]PNU18599.1 hypothetical protein C2E25_16795 [Geothermobacter hydrogeniphilus]
MTIEQLLANIRVLLENGAAGEASDLLCGFLYEKLGKLTTVNLPSSSSSLPPRVIVSHLRKSLNNLLPPEAKASSVDSASYELQQHDFELILQTSEECEVRQRAYRPGQESLVVPIDAEGEAEACSTSPDISSERLDGPELSQSDRKEELSEYALSSEDNSSEDLLDAAPEVKDLSEEGCEFLDFYVLEGQSESNYSTDSEILLDDGFFYDEFDDERQDLTDVKSDGKISREERAWQVAYELGLSYGWDERGIALLQEVFVERGWQQARVAMEYLLETGMTPEQLLFAKELKESWEQRTELMIAIHRKSSELSGYCYLGEKILSWRVAIAIVRSFDGCSDFDEIDQFVNEAFDAWYSSGRLRRSYRTFLQYLRSVAKQDYCFSANLLEAEPVGEQHFDPADLSFSSLKDQLQDAYYCFDWRAYTCCEIFK